MTKESEFLFIVQTAILANAINLASDTKSKKTFRHVFSATGVLGTMNDAIYASKRIPNDVSACDAANDFCTFMFANLRKIEEKAAGKKLKVPNWVARG